MQVEGFGFKNAWFAVKGGDPEAIARALGLEIIGPSDWHDGIDAAYDFGSERIFITPLVDGWTLAVGTGLFDLVDEDAFAQTTETLSRLLGTEVQFFGTHRVVEAHAWARAFPDGLRRAFMYVGDKGETIADTGGQSREEQQLGFRFFDERSPESSLPGYWEREDLRFPDEGNVMQLAGVWSVDPTALEGRDLPNTVGLLCKNASRKPTSVHKQAPGSKPWWKFWSGG